MSEFDFSAFPTMTTPRLIFRQSFPSDAADLFSYLNDAEVLKYEVFAPMKEVADAVSMIESTRQRFLSKMGSPGVSFLRKRIALSVVLASFLKTSLSTKLIYGTAWLTFTGSEASPWELGIP